MNKQTKNYKKLVGVASVALCSVALATGFLTHTGMNTGQTVLADVQNDQAKTVTISGDTQDKTAAQQLYDALNDASVTQINIETDISLPSSMSGKVVNRDGLNTNIDGNQTQRQNRNITINANNKTIDFGSWNFDYNGDNSSINVSNANLEGTNFYGPFSLSNSGNITYTNVTYNGSQFVYAPNGTVKFAGMVNVNSGNQYEDGVNVYTDQENIQAKNIEFLEGSQYTGTGNVVLFNLSSGKITLDENAKVSLIPNEGNANQPIIGVLDDNNGGILLKSSSNLTIKPLSQVNVSYPVTMTGATLNIQSPNNTTATPLLSLSKTITMNNSSAINVTGNTNQNGTLVNGLSAANLIFNDSNSTINVQTNKTDNNNPLATSLDGFKNNEYSWEMKDGSGNNLTTDFTKYDANQYKSLKISKSAKSIGIDDSSIQLSKNNDNKVNISYTPSLNNVAEQDTVKYDLSIKNGETDKTPSPKPEITGRTSSFNGLGYSTPAAGDVITVTSYLNNKESGQATKTLNQKDIDNLTDSGTTNPQSQPEPQLETNTASLQSGLVNYVKGYGVLLWQLTANGLEPTTQYQPANSYVPYYGDYQIVDGIKYLHIANQNTWIQAQYLQDPTQLPEIPMNNTAVAGNVPYGIYLRDGSGNMTEQIIEPGTSWQVFAKKTFHGHTYYRLGNDQQWLEDTYIQSMN
ncbi:pectate lyase-like adhesive domain-containing protein [Holzapfeliella floricola]|nr:pectate lyase-like adhesive domain-containing protein [Holzapfeliella floricola]